MTFHYAAFRALKKESGAVGAFVELTELAIREFKSRHQTSGIDFDMYIRTASTRNGMHLHYKEWPSTLARIARSYIMQTNESLERFLAEYAHEYETFFRANWRSKRQDESRLDYVLDCAGQRALRASFQYDLISYYVDVRHATVHPPGGNQLRALQRKWVGLAEHFDEIREWFPSAGLPNAFEEIKFGDHKLFHRAVQEFAADLSERSRPPDAVLGEIAVQATAYGRHSKERAIGKAAKYLQTRFGLELDASMAIARYHLSGPLAQR